MEKQKNACIEWVKSHKKWLVIAGVSVGVIIGLIAAIKNPAVLQKLWNGLKDIVCHTKSQLPAVIEPVQVIEAIPIQASTAAIPITRLPHNVCIHKRTLPLGWKASAEKIATAAEYGIELLAGETWVKAYSTGV